jgi:hypothetical protein
MVTLFWVELLSLAESGLGLVAQLNHILSMLAPSILLPWFHISLENRDLV